MSARLSIIVPTLDEGAVIEELLGALQPLRALGHEIILSDGGSSDDTCARAAGLVDNVVCGSAGRAAQMNRGAATAVGDVLWFVHADTRFVLPVVDTLADMLSGTAQWGFHMIRLDARPKVFRVIEWLINRRSSFSRVGTGDQGLFVRRDLFEQVAGFAVIPLMEDVDLSKRLRKRHDPQVMKSPLLSSARRWQQHGIARTVLLMWRLRLAYFLGVSPQRLAAHYRLCSSPTRES